jgi:hypothetical protein
MNQRTSTSDTRICYRSSTSQLEVYVSVEEPTKGGPLHLGHFPPSINHKNQARVTYSIDGGNTNFPRQPQARMLLG